MTSSSERTLPGYWRVDAALFFNITEKVRLQANAENVFNTKNMNRFAFMDAGDAAEPAWPLRDAYAKLLEEQGGQPGESADLALQVLANNPVLQGPGSTPYDLYLHPRQIFLGLRFEFR